MKIIGITGPTGAGKTTVLGALEDLGAAVIDCDAVYHRLLAEDGDMLAQMRARFGHTVFDGQGHLDRKALGAVVFSDPAALADLNAITHGYVNREIDRLIAAAEEAGRPAAAVDAIALLEGGLKDKCDATVAVLAPAEVRVERIMAREGISRDYARARVAAQKPDSYFEDRCDYVFQNDGPGPEDCKARAAALFRTILQGGN